MRKWAAIGVGYVFIVSGIAKLMDGDFRIIFYNLGLPYPDLLLYVIAIIEITCGALICARIYTKQAVKLLIVIMISAIFLTKLPLLSYGAVLHFLFESRLNILLLILLIALLNSFDTNSSE